VPSTREIHRQIETVWRELQMAPAPPARAPQLSDGQQKHFETFGYLHLQALFTPDEIAAATARASALWAANGGEGMAALLAGAGP